MKKKLLITGSTFPRWSGDSEPRFILDVAKQLNQYYDVTVFVPSAYGAKKYEELEGVKIYRYRYFPMKKYETLCYPGAIMPRIKEKKARIILVPFLLFSLYFNLLCHVKKYDVVLANWLIPQGIIQRFFKVPYVLTGLGGDVTALNKGVMLKWKKSCIRRAAGVIAVSHVTKREIENIYPVKEIQVITMGCQLDEYGCENKEENYFGTDKKVVLFVGRLVEKKGCKYLIRAMSGMDAKLIIIGDGPLRNELESLAKELGTDVEFWGAADKNKLKIMYASADIFVVPSVDAKDGDKEGMPTTIIEAMASQVPIIASEIGGVADLIVDRSNGILVKQKNVEELHRAIELLINDEKMCENLIINASKTSQNYDYRIIGTAYKEVIDKACR